MSLLVVHANVFNPFAHTRGHGRALLSKFDSSVELLYYDSW